MNFQISVAPVLWDRMAQAHLSCEECLKPPTWQVDIKESITITM